MRNIDNKILSNAFQFLELGVFGLHLLERAFQLGAGFVQFGAEERELAASQSLGTSVKVAVGQFAGVLQDSTEFFREITGKKRRDKQSHSENRGGALEHFPTDIADFRVDLG